MSMWMQILLGALPGLLLFAGLAVWKRKGRLGYIAAGAAMLLLAVTAAIGVPRYLRTYEPADGAGNFALTAAATPVDTAEATSLAYRLAQAEEYALAREVLASAREKSVYDKSLALCEARVCRLAGDDALADVLYQKAGVKPEEQPDLQQITFKGKDSERIAEAIIFTERAYPQYLIDGVLEEETAAKMLSQLGKADGKRSLFALPFVRMSRLKLQVLCGDYRSVAQELSAYSDSDELIMASELYIKGFVQRGSFSESYVTAEEMARYALISEKLERAYEKYWSDRPRAERTRLRALMASYNTVLKNPVLGKIATELDAYAGTLGTAEISKIYLQLAKIQNYLGGGAKTEQYIQRAIDSAGASADGAYTAPMYEIAGIAGDKDAPERLKNVAQYAGEVIDNALPIKIKEAPPASEAPDNNTDDTPPLDIDQQLANSIVEVTVKRRAALNIVSIDPGKFPQVTATVTVAGDLATTPEELRQRMELYDCDARIRDFTVEKVTYSKANILLVCDTSGSMAGDKITRLRSAVADFIDTMEPIEAVGLMDFDSAIRSVLPIGTDAETLREAALALDANGGTAIFQAVEGGVGEFSRADDTLNILLLMSDGQDNSPQSREAIGRIFKEVSTAPKNIAVYALGLGSDVDAEYMQYFSDCSGGVYMYADSSESIGALFTSLRDLAQNQYRVTYTATDTLSSTGRSLTVSIGGEMMLSDTKYYSLDGSESDGPDRAVSTVYADGRAVYGLTPHMLYQTGGDHNVILSGEGFQQDDALKVSLHSTRGGIEYNSSIEITYIDGGSCAVTIPGAVWPGGYDVHVSINGKTAVLAGGLYIARPGSEKETTFGPYRFLSQEKSIAADGTVVMDGNVTLGGWLTFKGEVRLRPVDDHQAVLTDYQGGRILYDAATAEGSMTKFLADKRIAVPVMPLGELPLFNDRDHDVDSDEYQTTSKSLPLCNVHLFSVARPSVRIYPNRMVFLARDLQFADKKLFEVIDSMDLFGFSLDFDFGGTFSAARADVILETELGAGSKTFRRLNMGKIPLGVAPKGKIKIDTYQGDYLLDLRCKFESLNMGDSENGGFGFALEWKDSKFDAIRVYADFEVSAYVQGIAVTFSDFMVGLSDISENTANPLYWTIEGSTTISMLKLSAYLPGLPDPFGDVALLECADTTVSLNLGKCNIGIKTTMKTLGIEIGSAEMEVGGGIKYKNVLLGLDGSDYIGFRAKHTRGINFDVGIVKLDIQGAGEIALLNSFLGIELDGRVSAYLDLWLFCPGFDAGGSFTIGLIPNRSGAWQFVILARKDGSHSNDVEMYWSIGNKGGYVR